MGYLINNQQKIDDIIFANRNKMYGAYAIRSAYGATVFKSLGLMILGFGMIISIGLYLSNGNNNGPVVENNVPLIHDSILEVIYNMDEPKPLPPEPHEHTASSNPPASSGLSTVINETTTTDTSIVDLSLPPTNGVPTGTGPVGPETPSTTIGGPVSSTTVDVDPPVIFPDSPPEFEGGLKALYGFLAAQLKYPPVAAGDGVEGTVFVKFVVDENGKVTNLSLLNKMGYGLDEEALRVVGMIPKFKKPGMVNNKPVKVFYQLPIKFKLR